MMTCLELRLRWRKGWLLLVKRCEKRTYQKSALRISSRNHNLSEYMLTWLKANTAIIAILFFFWMPRYNKSERCWTHTFFFFHSPPVELLGEKMALHRSLLWDIRDHSASLQRHPPARHLRQHHSKSVNRHLGHHPPATPSSQAFGSQNAPRWSKVKGRRFWSASTFSSCHHAWHVLFSSRLGLEFGYKTRPGTFVGFQPGGGWKKITSSSSWSACTTGSSGFLTQCDDIFKKLCLVIWNWANQEHTHTQQYKVILCMQIYTYTSY